VFDFKADIPFKDDLAKISRFAKFIAEKEGLFMGDNYSTSSNLMTASSLREEKILFERIYEADQNIRKAEEDLKTEVRRQTNINPEEDHEKEEVKELTKRKVIREVTKWRPDKLLCSRFKLKDPFENLIEIKDSKTNQSKFVKGEVYENKGLNSLQNQLIKEEGISSSNTTTMKAMNNERNNIMLLNGQADLNLFEEIFGD
jgi:hypothetical protein